MTKTKKSFKAKKYSYALKKKVAKSRFTRQVFPKQGSMYIKRKMPVITIGSSATAGLPSISDVTGNCIAYGTPVLSAGYATGYYDLPFTMLFYANQIANVAELQALFDQYKLNSVTVKMANTFNIASQGNVMPYVEYVTDDDDAAMHTVSAFRERMGIKTKFFNSSKPYVSIKVKLRSPIASPVNTSSYVFPGTTPKWINSSTIGIPHFGLRGVIKQMYLPASTGYSTIVFDNTFSISLKDVQ